MATSRQFRTEAVVCQLRSSYVSSTSYLHRMPPALITSLLRYDVLSTLLHTAYFAVPLLDPQVVSNANSPAAGPTLMLDVFGDPNNNLLKQVRARSNYLPSCAGRSLSKGRRREQPVVAQSCLAAMYDMVAVPGPMMVQEKHRRVRWDRPETRLRQTVVRYGIHIILHSLYLVSLDRLRRTQLYMYASFSACANCRVQSD